MDKQLDPAVQHREHIQYPVTTIMEKNMKNNMKKYN